MIMVLKLMKKTFAPLVFSLFCGLIYFGLAFVLILNFTEAGGSFLAFMFAPAIICGGALIIIKAIKIYIEEENEKKLNFLFWSHVVLAVVSATLAIEAILF